jgi:opacity protein-like surface antigen
MNLLGAALKIGLWVAIFTLFSSSFACAESNVYNTYISADAGKISAPGFKWADWGRTKYAGDALRVVWSVQPVQGWGTEMTVMSSLGAGCGGCSGSQPSGIKQMISANAFELQDIYVYPVNDRVSIFGKVGFAYTRYKAEVASGLTIDQKGIGIAGGIGMQFNLYRRFGARIQYEEFGANSGQGGPNRFRYLSVGWIFRLK